MGRIITASQFLDTELYAVREAARLLQMTPITLRRWLEGGRVSGTFYAPVIRQEPTGSDIVTWGEYLEAGMLWEFRKMRRVPLQGMRPFIDELRRIDGSKYPLADFQPDVDIRKRELVLRAQERVGLEETTYFLRRVGSRTQAGGWQTQWAEPVRRFIERVEFDVHVARRHFPLGKEKPVVIDPEVVFGIPQVQGIRTEIIGETYAELGNETEVAEDWGLTPDEVRAALQWEMRLKEQRKAA
jgi:uncharacterized protein (DUF433 family)